MKKIQASAAMLAALLSFGAAQAKLPPLSEEAKAKAAEATAKTNHGNAVANYQLCKSMERVAAVYLAEAKKAGKDVKPTATPPCADPGPFVYTPPAAASAPAATTTAAAAPAAAPAKPTPADQAAKKP